MARWPPSGNAYPVTPRAYPGASEVYPVAVSAYPSGVDVVAPVIQSSVIDATGLTLTMTYNEALDEASEPATGAFALAGTASTVSAVNVTGSTCVLTLDTAVFQGETVTFDYTPGGSPIQDLAGNDAAALNDYAVTNNSTVTNESPVTFRAANGSTSATVTNGGQEADYLGLYVSWIDLGGGFIVLPSGFSQIETLESGLVVLAEKVEAASPPASYTVELTDALPNITYLFAYDAVDAVAPRADSDAASGSGASAPAPSVTAAEADSRLVCLWSLSGSGDAPPGSMTQRNHYGNKILLADETVASGTTGTRTATQSGSGWQGFSIALSP